MPNPKLLENLMVYIIIPWQKTPFATVEDYVDDLFDKHPAASELAFFRSTTLSEIEYNKTDENPYFEIKNTRTNESIQVSNRDPRCGELRSWRLRQLLDQRKLTDSTQTIYDTLTRAVQSSKYSSLGNYTKQFCLRDTDITSEHYDLFAAFIVGKIHDKKMNIKCSDFDNDNEISARVLQSIDFVSIFTATGQITRNISLIKKMSDLLAARGCIDAAQAADTLNQNLNKQIESLRLGDLTVAGFINNCNHFITDITSEHYDLFAAFIVGKIHDKKMNIKCSDFGNDNEISARVLQSIDFVSIFKATGQITRNISLIKEMSDLLAARGCIDAARAADTLNQNLNKQIERLRLEDLTVAGFIDNCNRLIKESQAGELKNHRSLFGRIWHGIQVALNIITFGAFPISPTKSIQQIMKLQVSVEGLDPNKVDHKHSR